MFIFYFSCEVGVVEATVCPDTPWTEVWLVFVLLPLRACRPFPAPLLVYILCLCPLTFLFPLGS